MAVAKTKTKLRTEKVPGLQYSWLDKTTSYFTRYEACIKIWYQKNVELIYHKR